METPPVSILMIWVFKCKRTTRISVFHDEDFGCDFEDVRNLLGGKSLVLLVGSYLGILPRLLAES